MFNWPLLFFSVLFASQSWGLSLKEALEKVKDHPTQRSVNLETDRAGVNKDKSWLNLTPALSGSWRKTSSTTLDEFSPPLWTMTASLNIFSSLSDYYNISARSSAFAAAKDLEESTLIRNELNVAELFFQCLYAQRSSQAYQEAYQSGLQISEIEKSRYGKGIKSRDDYLKLKVDAENNHIRFITEQNRRDVCYSQLKYWVGDFTQIDETDLNPNDPSVISPSLADHPAIKSARENLEAYKSFASATVGSNFPRLDLQYQRYYEEAPNAYSNLIYLTASWNLYDSGQTLSQIRSSYIDVAKAEEDYKNTEKSLKRDMETQMQTLKDRNRQFKIVEENLRDIKLTFKTSLSRFRAGAITANDVALDQSRVILATISYYDIWLQRNLSYVRFQASLGKRVSMTTGDKK